MGGKLIQLIITRDCHFRKLFGSCEVVTLRVWTLSFGDFWDKSINHMEWGLMFLMMSRKENVISSLAGVDEKHK